jgi:hypothetical protein
LGCRPFSVLFEVNPSPTQSILLDLQKFCDANGEATWSLDFQLREGSPLATVVRLSVALNPEYFAAAEATAAGGELDDSQVAAAKIAASVAEDPDADVDDKRDAVQQVIAARTTGTGPR